MEHNMKVYEDLCFSDDSGGFCNTVRRLFIEKCGSKVALYCLCIVFYPRPSTACIVFHGLYL